jgi:hypothetical protein
LAAILSVAAGSGVAWGQDGPGSAVLAPSSAPVIYTGQGPTGSQYGIWGEAEYLLWWIKGNTLSSPLVTGTTLSAPATLANAFTVGTVGSVGGPGTTNIVGTNAVNYGVQSGGRFGLGGWFDSEGTIGIEARGFFLGQGAYHATASSGSSGTPSLFVPVNVVAGGVPAFSGPTSIAVALPGFTAGSVSVFSHTDLWGAELNGLFNLTRRDGISVDLLGGFRYANLHDDLTLSTSSVFLPGGLGGVQSTIDTFSTHNNFYGGNLGARMKAVFGDFFVDVTGKVALGGTQQTIDIHGATASTFPGGASGSTGLLALASNSGTFSRSQFSVIPEAEVKLGYNFTQCVSAYVGYNFMYWSDVVRSGQVVNTNVDARGIINSGSVGTPTNNPPGGAFTNTNFWAQGVTFGVAFKF